MAPDSGQLQLGRQRAGQAEPRRSRDVDNDTNDIIVMIVILSAAMV